LSINAQHRKERIKSLKIAFITERLQLTEKEAEQFWPIYNAFEDANHEIRTKSYQNKKNIDFETISEKEAKELVDKSIILEAQKYRLEESFIKDLQRVLPAKKIILLKMSEEAFKQRMFDEFKKRREKP
jgi:hypothetical protein